MSRWKILNNITYAKQLAYLRLFTQDYEILYYILSILGRIAMISDVPVC
jgi:hypothetical protein